MMMMPLSTNHYRNSSGHVNQS